MIFLNTLEGTLLDRATAPREGGPFYLGLCLKNKTKQKNTNNKQQNTPVHRYVAAQDQIAGILSECFDVSYAEMVAEMRNVSFASEVAGGSRQWVYQTCTEFGRCRFPTQIRSFRPLVLLVHSGRSRCRPWGASLRSAIVPSVARGVTMSEN